MRICVQFEFQFVDFYFSKFFLFFFSVFLHLTLSLCIDIFFPSNPILSFLILTFCSLGDCYFFFYQALVALKNRESELDETRVQLTEELSNLRNTKVREKILS